jgi:hypothetical protein
MPDRETCRRFMASRLSLGTRIRCQSLRLRRPLRALEIDSLHGQAGGSSCQESTIVGLLVFGYQTNHYLFDETQTNNS